MRSGGTRAGLPHAASLDGLRGIAVAAVLAFHAEVAGVSGGFLGVSAFFTLSGFLITALLLREHATHGRIHLRAFWARRARRLLPASLLTLLAVAVVAPRLSDAHQLSRLRGDGLAAVAQVANWRFVAGDRSYAALFSDPSPLQHYWSLAVEEQLYLVLPLLVLGLLATARGRRLVAGLALGAAALASTAAMALLFDPASTGRAYYGTDTRAAEVLIGAVGAVLVVPRLQAVRGRARLAVEGRAAAAIAVAGVAALGGMLAAWVAADQAAPWLYHGGFALHAVLTLAVIAAALVPGPVRSVLSWRPLVLLGAVSYGVYLFHWPLFVWLDEARTGLDGPTLLAVRVVITLALATLSYHFVERPIRRGQRLTSWRPALAAPAAVGAVVIAMVLAAGATPSRPAIVFDAVRGRPAAAAGPAPVTPTPSVPAPQAIPNAVPVAAVAPPPEPEPVTRIMVVGDSVAQTLGRGLERWGRSAGVEVWNSATYWCGIPRGGIRTVGVENRSSPHCDAWAERWAERLDHFQPQVVVVLSSIWDGAPRFLDGWPGFLRGGDPAFDAHVVAEYRAAVDVLSSRGAEVVWLTAPCAADAGITERMARQNRVYLPQLYATHSDRMRVIALEDRLCPGDAFSATIEGRTDIRPDGLHFSDPGADWVAGWLGPELLRRT